MIDLSTKISVNPECESRLAQEQIYFHGDGYAELLESTVSRNHSDINFEPSLHVTNKPTLPLGLLLGSHAGSYYDGTSTVVLSYPQKMNSALVHETQHAFDDADGKHDELTPPFYYLTSRALALRKPLYFSVAAQSIIEATGDGYTNALWPVTNLTISAVLLACGIRYSTAPLEKRARSAQKEVRGKVFFSRHEAPHDAVDLREFIKK